MYKAPSGSKLPTFLRNYRATPHSTTAKSPAELLHGRQLRIKLPGSTNTSSKKSENEKKEIKGGKRKSKKMQIGQIMQNQEK